MAIQKLQKRDGSFVEFNTEKVVNAVYKAAQAAGRESFENAKELAEQVILYINEKSMGKTPTVEDIQDAVEKILIQNNHPETAKAFILYRKERSQIRKQKEALIGKYVDKNLSINALKILKERFLQEDENKNIIETPDDMFRRVAKNIAEADSKYNKNADITILKEQFYQMMKKTLFLPNSPTLMNAGTKSQLLIASHVLEIEDRTDSIYNALRLSALIQKQGSGTGFSFSRMRPRHAPLETKKGIASGPLSFMQLFDKSTEIIKQGGRKRGANMGVIRVDHPDILQFITAKEDPKAFQNFNISIGITEEFMGAVENKRNYSLIDPITKKETRKMPAKEVFDLIATMAWKNGEPGILFLDRINKKNPTPTAGKIETTSPCAELPLIPNECAPLGSINVSKFVKETRDIKEIDYERLKEIVHLAVHFLDNTIDQNKFPSGEIEANTKASRKIGLGIMGFADLLFRLKIPYNSKLAVETAGSIMKFINYESKKASTKLAEERGAYPNFEKSIYARRKYPLRNATTTAIAPTGTTSLIADCSSGIEPVFALSYTRKVVGAGELLYVNKYFKEEAKEKGVYSEELMKKVAEMNSLKWFSEIPSELRNVFVMGHEIPAKWHVMIQAAFQEHVDNGVSKSVNLKNTARKEDVVKIFKMAYDLGCKGITVYRDQSRSDQILSSAY
jgi:ribonucleoside-diphosphate reductase alpha chain